MPASRIVPAVLTVLVALWSLIYLVPVFWDPNPTRRLAVFLLGYAWFGTLMMVTSHAARVSLGLSLERAAWSLQTAGVLGWVFVLSGLTWRLARRGGRPSATLVVLVLGLLAFGFLVMVSLQLAFSEPGGWVILFAALPGPLLAVALLVRWAIRDLRRGRAPTAPHRDPIP